MIVLILRARKKSCLVHLPDNSKFNQCENKTEERGGTEWSIFVITEQFMANRALMCFDDIIHYFYGSTRPVPLQVGHSTVYKSRRDGRRR